MQGNNLLGRYAGQQPAGQVCRATTYWAGMKGNNLMGRYAGQESTGQVCSAAT